MIVFSLLGCLVLTMNTASTMATCGTHGRNVMKTPVTFAYFVEITILIIGCHGYFSEIGFATS